ncbi:hypothetical protein [Nocardiopsis tropica]|uniref:Uncharacterized protein n=1 Tax=Nocardiopsis tropica TaxID=109330 RepID=A0ABU7KL94_9ACTN|nr:hypothetical protein [Nocardiopsis umidischolae]MEE2050057.1 hypothetical protein [Nocardiopsis umidischolae]
MTEEFHLRVRIRMTADERRSCRSEHAMADGESLRERLAAIVAVELDGLGSDNGWWHEAHVN